MKFSLKLLHCGYPALPLLKAVRLVSHFPAESAHAHYGPERRGFCTSVHSLYYVAMVTAVVINWCVTYKSCYVFVFALGKLKLISKT